MTEPELCDSLAGRLLVVFYGRLPVRRALLEAVVRREGGEFRSASLRRLLERYYGVRVGAHSYGSLLTPGMADRGTAIGRYVSIGPNVRRFGAAHPMNLLTMHPYWYNPKLGRVDISRDVERTAIRIESEAWIGANVSILPGCTRIGFGAVVGAGSVVTKDVADFAVVVGNPAKQIETRLTATVRQALLLARPWDLPPEDAAKTRDAMSETAF